ncbi:MAG: MFS transporter [Candidatus Eiseniibacteriota bacterium]
MTGPVRTPCDELAIRARADARAGAGPASGRPAPSWVLTAAILGSSLAFIDGTVVNVALPSIQRELHATVTDVQWVVEAYLLFLSALLLVGGALGDRFGRRRVFAIGVLLFTIASAACALARDVPQLVAARSLQGIGAALLVPGSLALIGASFRDAERGRAIGTWSAFSAITTALGPLVGGWLVAHSWRWAFLLNLPLGLAVLAILALRVPESRDDEAVRLDLPGTALVTAGLGGIVYGLLEWGRAGAPAPLTLLSLALGVLSLLLFIAVESRSAHPIVPLALFRSRTFAGANLLTLFLYGALGSVFFFLPLDLIQVHGYSPAAAGAAILPFVALLGGLSRWSGSLAERIGPRIPLVIGPALSAVGFALFARPGTSGSYWTTFFPAVVVLGLGMSLTVAPLSTTVLGAVPGHRVGVASGINNAVARIGGLLAVALAGLLVTGTFERELDARVPEASVGPEIRRTVLARSGQFGALEPPASATGPEADVIRAAVPEAFTEGFRAQAWAAALCALLSAVAAAWLIEPLQRKRPLPKAEVVARKDSVPQVSDTRP